MERSFVPKNSFELMTNFFDEQFSEMCLDGLTVRLIIKFFTMSKLFDQKILKIFQVSVKLSVKLLVKLELTF